MSDSWGFHRRPSPAMKRKGRRLKSLVIDEVSSVPEGAGHGVKVVLRKSDEQRSLDMELSPGAFEKVLDYLTAHIARKLAKSGADESVKYTSHGRANADVQPEDIAKAAADNVEYALQEQRHALAMFPKSKSVGEALAKWHKTEHGRAVQSAYLQDCFEKMQKRAGDVPHVHHAQTNPAGRNADPSDNSMDGMSADPVVIDWGDDKQATAAYRAEKARKAERGGIGGHEGENIRPARRVSGVHANPKPLSP